MSDKPKRSGKFARTARIRPEDYAKGHKPLINAMAHLPWPSPLSPSGLVPSLCLHGLAALPASHPPFAGTPRYNADHEELPAHGGNSWIRSRYVTPDARCVVCKGQPEPADFVEYRT